MAKANVLVRRIRAYDRVLVLAEDLEYRRQRPSPETVGRFKALRVAAAGALDAFLANRTRGPWAGYAA